MSHFSNSCFELKISFIVGQKNKKSVTLKCRNNNCQFNFCARYKETRSLCLITKMNPVHACDLVQNPIAQRKISKTILNNADANVSTTRALVSSISSRHQHTVSYNTARTATIAAKTRNGLIIKE